MSYRTNAAEAEQLRVRERHRKEEHAATRPDAVPCDGTMGDGTECPAIIHHATRVCSHCGTKRKPTPPPSR